MEWYYEQKESTQPLTQEMIDQFTQKHFESGRPYQVGDIILYGLRQDTPNDQTLITFHVDEINVKYIVQDNPKGSHILPILIPIN